jgi:hypothetical protein
MTDIKTATLNDKLAAVGIIVLIGMAQAAFHSYVSSQHSSAFHSMIADTNYSYWHAWSQITLLEIYFLTIFGGAFICIIFLQIDALYNLKKTLSKPLRNFLLATPLLLLFGFNLYCDFVCGYAIYPDHVTVLMPFSLRSVRYDVKDIARIEVGCHVRASGKHDHWDVPSYKIVFRDGRVLSVFDLAGRDYRDKDLMYAVLNFDAKVKAAHVPRVYRKNFLGMKMSASYCFPRMAERYPDEFSNNIDQTFRLPH